MNELLIHTNLCNILFNNCENIWACIVFSLSTAREVFIMQSSPCCLRRSSDLFGVCWIRTFWPLACCSREVRRYSGVKKDIRHAKEDLSFKEEHANVKEDIPVLKGDFSVLKGTSLVGEHPDLVTRHCLHL